MGVDADPDDGRRPRLLTGDRPTGPLHLGHFVGTLQNRVSLQDTHDTFIVVADQHMLTTRLDRLGEIEANIREDVLGNLAVGVDPDQGDDLPPVARPRDDRAVPLFRDARSVSRAQRIPTLKDKVRELQIAQPSYGLLGYPILQAADILLMRGRRRSGRPGPSRPTSSSPARSPVASIERFAPVFPVPAALAPKCGTLPGTDGSPKMSRSVGNTINLFDDAETVRAKVMWMYTDPTPPPGD